MATELEATFEESVIMIYNDSLATLTDLYQVTMAYGYWKNNTHEQQAVFNLFFRKGVIDGAAVVAGLGTVIEFLENWRFNADDRDYLRSLKNANGSPMFEESFLAYLRAMEFSCSVEAMPEGTLALPNEPILNITGPIIQCQLLETALLNIINFQTLIASKAALIRQAAGDDKVSEFGLRRAQGIDGGLSASRAAFIGGCNSTSNVMAGKLFGIPVVGTHAHSWVMSFPSELEAFQAYAFAMPDNCIFLVDTYNVEQGVRNAIIVGKELRQRGFEMKGIRLDSGDLAALSIMSRKMLDEAGFTKAIIVASNDLDEKEVMKLKDAGSKIDVWGIGTKLVTSYDQPALGGVYKLGAVLTHKGWERKIKLSADAIKTSNPGKLNVGRLQDNTKFLGDTIVDSLEQECMTDYHSSRSAVLFLLEKVFDQGKLVAPKVSIFEAQDNCKKQLSMMKYPGSKLTCQNSEFVENTKKNLIENLNKL